MRIVAVLLFCVVGCDGRTVELSDVKTASGKVYEATFVPSGSGTSSGYNFGKGGGFTSSRVSIPERYAVVIEWKLGPKWILEDGQAKILYSRLDRGDEVDVLYREEITVEQTGSRRRTGYQFVDAKKKTSK